MVANIKNPQSSYIVQHQKEDKDQTNSRSTPYQKKKKKKKMKWLSAMLAYIELCRIIYNDRLWMKEDLCIQHANIKGNHFNVNW